MMPSGKYYIGDLCYVLNNQDWDEVCSLTIKDRNIIDGEFTMKDGRRFAMYSTKFGDGEYSDQYGMAYCVDSGSIGCILASDITQADCEPKDLGLLMTFETDFVTGGGSDVEDWEGTIQFGKIAIETGFNEDEDDEYA